MPSSEDYIAPAGYVFTDPEDVENGCTCTTTGTIHECDAATACVKAGGRCTPVLAAPHSPQLLPTQHDGKQQADGSFHLAANLDLPPGWKVFCACLKKTNKTPTAKEQAAWPKAPAFKPPAGYAFATGKKDCGMPRGLGPISQDWECPEKDCTLVGYKKDSLQLDKLAEPGGSVKPKEIKQYVAIFCVHLDKAP